ncbi:MAG: DNA alkylation repair protein [Culturomica sp.]|nr:DNA alkylation repair protein [Culturomica sp.]
MKRSIDEKKQTTGDRIFKNEVKMYGVKIPVAVRIGKLVFQKIKHLPQPEIFGLCEELWQSGYIEEGHIACPSSNRPR